MKNILIMSCLTVASLSLIAQEGERPNPGTQISPELLEDLNRGVLERQDAGNFEREEINGWVSFEQNEYNYVYGPSAFYSYWRVITPDSLPRVAFSDGAYRSFVHSFGQIFDPTAEDMQYSDARLSPADGYEIDSIGFPSMYERVNHNGIDDTLVITIAITDKITEPENPYVGFTYWTPSGLLTHDVYVPAPTYAGSPEHGNYYGLTGVSDPGNNVEIQVYKFALTDADTEISWRAFPVDVVAGPDQVVYTIVEFQTSFETSIEDTAYVTDDAEGVATTNSYRMVYDYPVAEQTGYFFDLYRDDEMSYNCSYTILAEGRYDSYTGDYEWLNGRIYTPSWWGMRFEYYMNATSSVGITEESAMDGIKVYPNPANDNIAISMSNNQIISGTIEINDLAGRVVYSSNVENQSQINLDVKALGLTAGIYVINIRNEAGTMKQRLIVQ